MTQNGTWPSKYTIPPSDPLWRMAQKTLRQDREKVCANVWQDLGDGKKDPIRPQWKFAPSFGEDDERLALLEVTPRWSEERSRIRGIRTRFGEELEDLLDAERNIGVGWGDIFFSLQLPISSSLNDATRQARIALRRSKGLKVSHGARAGGTPTPFEVAEELLPFLNIMQDEGAVLDDTVCSDMLLGTASPPPGALGMTYEQIADVAYEVIHSSDWDRAYQQSVCRYLLALDAATTTAQELVDWVDKYGDDEIRERPDWYKLELVREM